MPEPIDTRLSRLRQRAERALASGRRGGEVLGVLETMTREAPDGSPYALFAHRHLAEIQLEGSPWRAALHLRRVIDAGAGDDSVHALMGLCHALLGNYRAAVSEYRKALKLAPRNPWYHHNLGHLLDVGLGEAQAALDHLRIAHRLQSSDDEITSSLAHCLARLGHLDEALTMAERAVMRAPRNREHRALLSWVQEGAPSNEAPPQRTARVALEAAPAAEGPGEPAPESKSTGTAGRVRRRSRRPALSEQVSMLLEAHMAEAGLSPAQVERALCLWADFVGGRSVRSAKPAVYAAAIEYAVAKLDCMSHVTQAALARRYGVTARSIANRYDEISGALSLGATDPEERAR